MKILNQYPPNIDKIRERFPGLPLNVVFTYGDIIYNPTNGFINTPLLVHEETHTKQQGNDPKTWWDKYLTDDIFRFNQELEAYRNQYKKMKRNIKDINKLSQQLDFIVKDFSGPMYGNIVSYDEAKELICHFN